MAFSDVNDLSNRKRTFLFSVAGIYKLKPSKELDTLVNQSDNHTHKHLVVSFRFINWRWYWSLGIKSFSQSQNSPVFSSSSAVKKDFQAPQPRKKITEEFFKMLVKIGMGIRQF